MDKIIFEFLKYLIVIACSCVITYYVFIRKNPLGEVHGRIDSVNIEVQELRTDSEMWKRYYLEQRHNDSVKMMALQNVILLEQFHRKHYQVRLDSLTKARSKMAPEYFNLPIFN